jgi:hypothetical protein
MDSTISIFLYLGVIIRTYVIRTKKEVFSDDLLKIAEILFSSTYHILPFSRL